MTLLAGIRCVLFDAVGTLLAADPPVAQVYQQVAHRYGSSLSLAEIERQFHAALAAEHRDGGTTSEDAEKKRWRRIVARVVRDVPGEHDAIFADLWDHFGQARHWQLFADVAGTWTQLRQRGFRLGIASNFDRRLRHVLSGHPLLADCPDVFVSSEIGYLKPDLRFFRRVETLLGVLPSEIALVGDDEEADARGAEQAGWRAILLDRSGNK